jgi:hypothetical protein
MTRPAAASILYDTGQPTGATRRLLLVSASFPPHAIVGATRWEQFGTRLTADGWAVDVIMEQPGPDVIVDWSRVQALPPGIRAIAISPGEPIAQRLYISGKRAIRGDDKESRMTTSINDASARASGSPSAEPSLRDRYRYWLSGARARRWISAAVSAAKSHVTSPPDIVVSSGPPHLAHLAGAQITAAIGRPHVIDLRDPWDSDLARWGNPRVALPTADDELRLMRSAAHTIANTSAAERLLRERAPWLGSTVSTILNGSDLAIQPAADRNAPFVAVHTGTIFSSRDPRPFLRAARSFIAESAVSPEQWQVVFMGHAAIIGGVPLPTLVEEHHLSAHFTFLPLSCRKDAHDLMRRARLLLAFPGLPTQVPFKIYEYASFSAWLLAMVGRVSAPADLLAGTSALVTDGDDQAAIKTALLETWNRHCRGEVPVAAGADGRFLRERQYERLTGVLDRLTRSVRG